MRAVVWLGAWFVFAWYLLRRFAIGAGPGAGAEIEPAADSPELWNLGLSYFLQEKIELLSRAIANQEGYGRVGKIPTTHNNPGDLMRGGDYIQFPTPEAGWDALYRQVRLMLTGTSAHYSLDQTFAEVARIYTATQQAEWATNVSRYVGLVPSNTLRQYLEV